MIKIIPEVVAIKKFVSKYYGYVIEKKKDDDLVIRRKLLAELCEIKKYLYNISKKHYTIKRLIRPLINEVDIFSKEIEYSLTGHRYPFLSKHSSINIGILKKLVKYDFFIIEKIVSVKEECKNIYRRDDIDESQYSKALSKIRNMLIEIRNKYMERENFLKKL